MRRARISAFKAPSIVRYTQKKNAKGIKMPCVFAQCTYGGTSCGPIWGHTARSVSLCLQQLTLNCDCGRPIHKKKFEEGIKVVRKPSKK